jgi:uncharacterized protein
MERLFLDANVLFSAAYHPSAGLLAIWRLKHVVLCSSRYAFREARLNLEEEEQWRRLDRLAGSLQFFDGPERKLPHGLVLPEKDIPILLAAIEAKADYLLTGDVRHFGSHFGKKIEGVTIMRPGDYLRRRKSST